MTSQHEETRRHPQNELDETRQIVIDLMPEEVQTILSGYYFCGSSKDTVHWQVTAVAKIIALAKVLPRGVIYDSDRAYCPLCGDGTSARYYHGFNVPEGLDRHLFGRGGLTVIVERPMLSELSKRYVDDIQNRREQARAKRVLSCFCELLVPGTCVDEIKKADCKKYIDKRRRDGLKPQSIDRELNIIVAMFNQAENYFPALEQWRPPRIPRPKIIDGRRERTWSEHEIKVILGELFAPKREDEQVQSAIARYRVGRKVQFCLLNGVRHSEMNLIPKAGINWEARQVRIRQGKTGNYKVIGPLGPTSMEILREFYNASTTDLVFSRSGNITPKFYRILREACERAGVPYGRSNPNGLVLHDARHTATTHLLESNVSPKTVQEWMGWSDKAFVLYYSHATKQSREQAGRSLEELAGRKTA